MIWYKTGELQDGRPRWARASVVRDNQPGVAVLCCPGPSLADTRIVRAPGRTVVAINTAFPRIDPDMWVGMDDPLCYHHSLLWMPFPKYFRGNYGNRDVDGLKIEDATASYLVSVEKCPMEEVFHRLKHDDKVHWPKHTMGVALHLLAQMGFKQIYLVGCDMGGASDYHDKRRLTGEQQDSNRRLLAQQVEYLKKWAKMAAPWGVELISSTPKSPINDFLPYVPEVQIPIAKVRESSMPHAMVAEKLRDTKVVCVLKGGGDYTLEYVQRLAAQVRQHLAGSKLTCLTDVCVPGMDDINFIPLRNNWPGWWSKMELFDRFRGKTLYLDLDTIITKDITPLLDAPNVTMLADLGGRNVPTSGLMYWSKDLSHLYDKFRENPHGNISAYDTRPTSWGDQAFIADHLESPPHLWQHVLPRGIISSYKFSTQEAIDASSVVCYHGKPRPHQTGWSTRKG